MEKGKWFRFDSENIGDVVKLAEKFTRSHFTKKIVGKTSVEGSEIRVNVRLNDGTIGKYTFGEYGVWGHECDEISIQWNNEMMKTLPKELAEEYLIDAYNYNKELNEKHLALMEEGAKDRKNNAIAEINETALDRIERISIRAKNAGKEAYSDAVSQIANITRRANNKISKESDRFETFMTHEVEVCDDELAYVTNSYLDMYMEKFGENAKRLEEVVELDV